ncbi:hypothetical protein G9A89_003422 [Geosiphon pyriformis]|nr:hypothetical protein G9A89_003422 [Geosiphon pyriformis]
MKSSTIFIVLIAFFASLTLIVASPEPLPDGWRYASANLLDERNFIPETNSTLNNIDKRDVNAQITFYQDNDLKNAACYGRNGLRVYNAKNTDMIAAMAMDGLEMCYKCVEIKNHVKSVKTIVVKVIDICGGCPNKQNIDLTRSAFSKLAQLDQGRVNIVWRPKPRCPTKGAWPRFEQNKRR